MTTPFADSLAQVIIADFAAVDPSGKLNVVGSGIAWMTLTPMGTTVPFYVAASISAPEKHSGTEIRVTLELRDEQTGATATLPGPTGEAEAMRIEQLVTFGLPSIPAGAKKPSHSRTAAQIVFGFPTGMPLAAGRSYKWKLRIDGQSRASWEAPFSVLAPMPDPIIGGPVGDSAIEGVEDVSADVPEDED